MCIAGKTFPKKRYFMSNSVKRNFLKLTTNKYDTVLENFRLYIKMFYMLHIDF